MCGQENTSVCSRHFLVHMHVYLYSCARKNRVSGMLQAKRLRLKLIVRQKTEIWKNYHEKKWFEKEKGRGKKNCWSEAMPWQSCDRKHERNSRLGLNTDLKSESAEMMLKLANFWEGERRQKCSTRNGEWQKLKREEVSNRGRQQYSVVAGSVPHTCHHSKAHFSLSLCFSLFASSPCYLHFLLTPARFKKENSNISGSRLLTEDTSPRAAQTATWWVATDKAPRRGKFQDGQISSVVRDWHSGSQRSFKGVTTALRCCMADWTQRGTTGAHFNSR